ncbi:MAG: Mth938-like domain-containing protein [Candidatus Aquirickettsiella sp.]
MELNLDTGEGRYQIRAYDKDFIQINEQKIHHSLIVMPDQLIAAWPPHSIADLTAENLQLIIDLSPSIVLLGSGENLAFPDPMLLNIFNQQKIGIEVMNNGAACRTYSVLMSEGRSVAAALLIA